MRILVAFAICVSLLVGQGCSARKAPPAAPESPPIVTSLGEMSQTQDGVRLTVNVFLVEWADHSGLTVGAIAENTKDYPIAYDPGGCSCPNPSPFTDTDYDNNCPRPPRPLCPCGDGGEADLAAGGKAERWMEFPLCPDNTANAGAHFMYEIEVEGERMSRHLEVSLPVSKLASHETSFWGMGINRTPHRN